MRPGRPVVYCLDIGTPGALFVAEAFDIRDGGAIFAINAPLTELRKCIQLFRATLAPVQQGRRWRRSAGARGQPRGVAVAQGRCGIMALPKKRPWM